MSNETSSPDLGADPTLDHLWTDADCDIYANVPEGTHRKLACSGDGPPSVRIGKRRRRYVPQIVRDHYHPAESR